MALHIEAPLAKSLGLHLAILVLLLFSADFSSTPEMVSVSLESEGQAPVEAVAVDEKLLNERVEQMQRERDAVKAAEEKRIRDLERRAEQAEKNRTTEEQRLKRVAEEKRKADAETQKPKQQRLKPKSVSNRKMPKPKKQSKRVL